MGSWLLTWMFEPSIVKDLVKLRRLNLDEVPRGEPLVQVELLRRLRARSQQARWHRGVEAVST